MICTVYTDKTKTPNKKYDLRKSSIDVQSVTPNKALNTPEKLRRPKKLIGEQNYIFIMKEFYNILIFFQ